jgi:hypothetical protein
MSILCWKLQIKNLLSWILFNLLGDAQKWNWLNIAEERLKEKVDSIETLENRKREKVILFVLELLYFVTLDATSIASRDALSRHVQYPWSNLRRLSVSLTTTTENSRWKENKIAEGIWSRSGAVLGQSLQWLVKSASVKCFTFIFWTF